MQGSVFSKYRIAKILTFGSVCFRSAVACFRMVWHENVCGLLISEQEVTLPGVSPGLRNEEGSNSVDFK